jgi:guanine deaminase
MNTNDDMHQHYLREAVQLAHEHMRAGAGGPFGALVVREGEIIGKGWNRVTSHNDPTAHAEVSAIRAACEKVGDFSLAGSVIYTSCEPCPMCLGAIWWSRIDVVYFASTRDDAARVGFDDAALYREVSLALPDRQLPLLRYALPEAEDLMNAWMQKDDKIPY